MFGKRIAIVCAMAATVSSGAQPFGTASYAIGSGQVVQALAAQGIHVMAAQVTMVADVVASRPDAEIEVLAIGPSMPNASADRKKERSWVKLGCRAPGACLPFYALVAMDSADAAARLSGSRIEKRSGATPERSVLVMRAGTRATLVLAGHEARIELAVISLEGGAMGRTIRVATPDYKQFYRARVAGANLLKGTF